MKAVSPSLNRSHPARANNMTARWLALPVALAVLLSSATVWAADPDGDGIDDDGDLSGTPGDNPCTGGATTNCDDNCWLIQNSNQADGRVRDGS